MKLSRKAGATSQIWQIFIRDSSSTTGAGLTGLAFNSSSLTAYYHRDTDTTATAISLVTMTVGTFTSSGFKEIDATNMPGHYQFCPPNAALTAGASSCMFHLKGATNMAALPIEVDLDSQVDVYLWNGTAVASPATAGIPDVNVKNMNNVSASAITTIKAVQGLTTADTIATYTGNTPQTGDAYARIGANGSGLTGITGATLSAAYDAAKTAAQAGDSMALTTAAQQAAADTLLGRNVAGGSSAGRLVKEALYVLRNKTDITAGTLTVYGTDDSTSAFTATVTTAAGNPISQIDPA